LSEYVCIPWCGLIVYQHNDHEVKNFVDEIYNDIMQWRMPNDQIVWAMISQKYFDIIQMIDAEEIPIKWELPEDYNFSKYLLQIVKKIIKICIPYGIIRLWQIRKR
jgi:hypothetical protein